MPPYARVLEPSAWEKASKISFCFFGRDADSSVEDREAEQDPFIARGVHPHAHHDLAGLGELDGVADEVDKDLAQPPRVSFHRLGNFGGLLPPPRELRGQPASPA